METLTVEPTLRRRENHVIVVIILYLFIYAKFKMDTNSKKNESFFELSFRFLMIVFYPHHLPDIQKHNKKKHYLVISVVDSQFKGIVQ